MAQVVVKPEFRREAVAIVHCPICTHRVEATVLVDHKAMIVRPGERCARCRSTLDAGFVMRLVPQAA